MLMDLNGVIGSDVIITIMGYISALLSSTERLTRQKNQQRIND